MVQGREGGGLRRLGRRRRSGGARWGGWSMPEDVAQAVVGLIDNEMITGELVIIDGGRHVLY